MNFLLCGDSQVLNGSLIVFSLRSADVSPVVAFLPPKIVFGGREATTGNTSALRRLHCLQVGKQKIWILLLEKVGARVTVARNIFFPFIFLATRTSSGAFIFLPSSASGGAKRLLHIVP